MLLSCWTKETCGDSALHLNFFLKKKKKLCTKQRVGVSKKTEKPIKPRKPKKKKPKKPNRKKKPIKPIRIFKKPTGSVRFDKPETEKPNRTEPVQLKKNTIKAFSKFLTLTFPLLLHPAADPAPPKPQLSNLYLLHSRPSLYRTSCPDLDF